MIRKKIVVFLLKIVKKVRGFDRSFKVYFPESNDKREALLWKLMVLNPLLYIDVNLRRKQLSKTPIDICIPVSLKDLKTLPYTIEGVRKYVKHPINKLYIVAKDTIEVMDLCEKYGLVFVNENQVLGYRKNDINYIVEGEDRSGWLFQQLIKLNMDTVTEMVNYLVIDADTTFIKPRVFDYKGKTIFDVSTERHGPYHIVFEKILKRKSRFELSFITHYMLFNKKLLRQLKTEIEIIHQKKWDDVIIELTDYNNVSGFSEYELYGNYVFEKYPFYIKKEYWFNSTPQAYIPNYIKSVSEHSYL